MKKMKEKFVAVQIDLPKEDLYLLMLKAHEADMTLNAFVNKLLKTYLDKMEYLK